MSLKHQQSISFEDESMSFFKDDQELSFRDRVIQLAKQIPYGRVTTYGTLASLAGSPRAARMVGGILHVVEEEIPWQRVINRHGFLSIRGCHYSKEFQKTLLEQEGVEVSNEFMVDLRRYGWWGDK